MQPTDVTAVLQLELHFILKELRTCHSPSARQQWLMGTAARYQRLLDTHQEAV